MLIVNYRTRNLLAESLQSLQRHPPTVRYEIIVVDNGSADGSAELVRRAYPTVRLIALPRNTGYPRATNVGLAVASGTFVLFLNTDVVIVPDAIDTLVAYLKERPRVGITGPQLKNPDGTIQDSAYDFYGLLTPLYRRTFLGRTRRGQRELRRVLLQDWDHTTERSVGWLMSSCCLVRRQALDEVGLLDERFFVYLSDTDLCHRMWNAHWQVRYTPIVSFVHHHRRASAQSWRVALIHVADWLRYVWKWRRQAAPHISSQL